VASLPDDLVKRRVYMLMVQGSDRGEIRLFERFEIEDLDSTIATCQQDRVEDLVMQIGEVLVENQGVHCPGEQVKAALAADREFEVGSPEPAPVTASEAFAPTLAKFCDEKFIHVSVMIFC
jgi:hypothetical protein